jgi:chromosome segregation ATPase
MPALRPFFQDSVDQLKARVEANWGDLTALQKAMDELGFRTTQKAADLRMRVGGRIADLAGSAGGEGTGAQTNNGRALASLRTKLVDMEQQVATAKQDIIRLNAELTASNAQLKEAKASEARLRTEMATAKATSAGSQNAALFGQVGLMENAPDFLLKAARTAFRKANHPDHKPPAEKAAAEARFKQLEQVFNTIDQLRGR